MNLARPLWLSLALACSPAWSVTLISPEEASLAPAAPTMATRGISRGPGVRMLAPQSTEVRSPFDFKVAFEARGGSKIDPSSVKVVYLRAQPVDLSARVRAVVSDQGLHLIGAETPPGEHQIQISVQDSEGRVGQTIVQLKVVK